jgi:hypothetical protein
MVFPWLVCTGFVTAFSALFTKNGRINAVYMNARACRRVTIKPKDVIWSFIVLLSSNVTILVLWTTLAPWTWQRVALEPVRMSLEGPLIHTVFALVKTEKNSCRGSFSAS